MRLLSGDRRHVRLLASGAAGACILVLFSSCGQQCGKPLPKPTETSTPASVQPIVTEGPAQAPTQTTVVAVGSTTLPIEEQIRVLNADIVETAGRRGSAVARLNEMRKNALSGDDEQVRTISDELRTMRTSLEKRLRDLPESVSMKKSMDAIEAKKADLMAQRSAILAGTSKHTADVDGAAAADASERLKTLEAGLIELQKQLRTELAEHRKLVQRARENDQEINMLSGDIGAKEAALAERLNALPAIKELGTEQAGLEARLREMKMKRRFLETTSQPAPRASPQPVPTPAVAP